jgi:hypothetical protein
MNLLQRCFSNFCLKLSAEKSGTLGKTAKIFHVFLLFLYKLKKIINLQTIDSQITH